MILSLPSSARLFKVSITRTDACMSGTHAHTHGARVERDALDRRQQDDRVRRAAFRMYGSPSVTIADDERRPSIDAALRACVGGGPKHQTWRCMQMTLVGCVNGKCESACRPNPPAAPTTRHLGTEDIAGTTRTPGGRPLPIAGL